MSHTPNPDALAAALHRRLSLPAPMFLLLVLLTAAAVTAAAQETSDRHLRFDFRAGAPPGTDYEALIERPAEIRKDIDLFRAEGEWRIRALFDFHAVYPVRKGQMVEVLTQYEGSEDFVPRVEFSEVLEVTRADPPCLRQHLKLVFTALTARRDYDYIITLCEDRRRAENAFLLKWTLDRSLDGKMFLADGSWYVKRIETEDGEMTYVRYYNRTGLTSEVPLTALFMRWFSAGDVAGMMNAMYREASDR